MKRLATPLLLSLIALLVAPAAALAAAEPNAAAPAGGAAIGEIIIASTAAGLLTMALLVLGIGHRTGRIQILGRLADWAERRTGYPGWSALPGAVATVALITALFGMYWDIALHIDVGRDEGPLANPAHYFILGGLFGIFTAGLFAMVLPKGKPSGSAIRMTRNWHAPLGGVLICACGAFSLLGFPLDDLWHRIFGQDVTLWGPTHLMLIGGAAMTLVGIAVLLVEGFRATGITGNTLAEAGFFRYLRVIALTGGFMLGLSTFQAEFDFGVAQFRMVFHPLLLMIAAGVGLVTARMWGGPGAALGAVVFFVGMRAILALLVGPVFGESTPHLPLYIVEAAVVELVALRVAFDKRPLAFGLWAGAGIGTFGLAAEWLWSHIWMPLPWPAALLPEGAILGFLGAMGGAVVGAWIGHRLSVIPKPSLRGLRIGAVAGAVVIALSIGYSLHKPAAEGVTASVELTEVQAAPERQVEASIRIEPAEASENADWLTVTAWQGGGLIVDRLEEVAPGRFETTEPIPVHGNWKSLIRLHKDRSMIAAPIFLPEDPAIPAEEVPAEPSFTREFVSDHEILQREQKAAAPWLTGFAYAVVIVVALGLLGLLTWGLHRLGAVRPQDPEGESTADRKEALTTHA